MRCSNCLCRFGQHGRFDGKAVQHGQGVEDIERTEDVERLEAEEE
jgi:hypothetical protein